MVNVNLLPWMVAVRPMVIAKTVILALKTFVRGGFVSLKRFLDVARMLLIVRVVVVSRPNVLVGNAYGVLSQVAVPLQRNVMLKIRVLRPLVSLENVKFFLSLAVVSTTLNALLRMTRVHEHIVTLASVKSSRFLTVVTTTLTVRAAQVRAAWVSA